MFMIDYRDIGWWYWLATVLALSFGIAGVSVGIVLAIGLVVMQLIYYVRKEKLYSAFTVQVRIATLIFFVVIYPDEMRFLYWIPTVGLWAQVLFGYCAMARCVSLLSWNRSAPLSLALLKNTFFSLPVRGSVQGMRIEMS